MTGNGKKCGFLARRGGDIGLLLLLLALGALAFGWVFHPALAWAGAVFFGGGMLLTILAGLVRRLWSR